MPWLIKGNKDSSENLFFVHVPRCGGTSLVHHYDVPKKVMKGRNLWGRFGMTLFFRRYKMLESANFPWKTRGNVMALVLFSFGLYLIIGQNDESLRRNFGVVLVVAALLFFVCLTFLFTAPIIERVTWIRRIYLLVVHYVLCRFMESIEWCTGTNKTGYMMHLTAHKLLAYGYVSPEEMTNCCTMAIVRNPYSRMVSIYNYNRFGSLESFPAFVEDWYKRMLKPYRETGELDEWYTPCHTIPQVEYTHYDGKQLVRSIVKQEELKYLNTKEEEHKAVEQDSSVSDLPDLVRSALLDMPRANSRATKKKWFDYYDQRTLDLVYEMYERDFAVFQYNPVLKQRPDLKPPATFEPPLRTPMKECDLLCGLEHGARQELLEILESGSSLELMRRDSWDHSKLSNEERRLLIGQSANLSAVVGRATGRFQSSLFGRQHAKSWPGAISPPRDPLPDSGENVADDDDDDDISIF